MEQPSYDDLVSQIIDCKVVGNEALFRQGAIVFYLKERMGVSAKQIGGDVGYSGRYVNMIEKTYACFPDESSRALDMSFSHHQIAAHTDSPAYWLEQAVINGWSVREMQRAIKGESPPDPMHVAEEIYSKVEKFLTAGGAGALYLYEGLSKLLREVDPDQLCIDVPEADQEETEEATV